MMEGKLGPLVVGGQCALGKVSDIVGLKLSLSNFVTTSCGNSAKMY